MPDRTITLTEQDQKDIAEVLSDAYGYRVGGDDPNHPEGMEPDDVAQIRMIEALSERLGIAFL
jgi:hypothetical protein